MPEGSPNNFKTLSLLVTIVNFAYVMSFKKRTVFDKRTAKLITSQNAFVVKVESLKARCHPIRGNRFGIAIVVNIVISRALV